jgi:hypothetical protein
MARLVLLEKGCACGRWYTDEVGHSAQQLQVSSYPLCLECCPGLAAAEEEACSETGLVVDRH